MYRYIGNKSKLLDYIIGKTKDIIGKSGTVADIMAGTGMVSLEYRKNGYNVIASDMMTYSKCHLITNLLNSKSPEFKNLTSLKIAGMSMYESILAYLNNLEGTEGYFYNEFSPEGIPDNGYSPRKYFTSKNAKKIDAIRQELENWIQNKKINSNEEAVLKHTLIMAVNKVANISGTYGYFLSKFTKNSIEDIFLEPQEFCNIGSTNNKVMQGFAEDVAKNIKADLCYIDPPYTKRQYAANYHILETIARGDNPIAQGKSGLRDWWDQHSKFCTKTRIRDSFKKVIKDMDCPCFLISYSEDGLLSINELVDFFEQFGKTTVSTIDYKRFRSNQSELPNKIQEYIIELYK